MTAIRLRFVSGNAFESRAIELREGTCVPIIPSHVECVTPAGKYAGAHGDGGFQARDPGYDGATPAQECFVDLPCTQEQHDKFYDAVEKSIGEAYDWSAILGYVLPGHHHTKFDAICSAKMYLLLRDVADWFPSHMPCAVPAHCIDPRDLLFGISLIIKVDH